MRKFYLDKHYINKFLFVSRHNKKNSLIESQYETIGKSVKIYGFYHAFCLCDGWERLVKDQFDHLRRSGLYDRMERIYCSFIGNERNVLMFKQIGGGKCEVVYKSEDPTVFEFPTLIYLSEFTKQQTEPFVGFYFHTKGASWVSKPEIFLIGETWRQMAEYFMFDRWRLAVSALLNGYSVYGTNYQECRNDAFRLIGGNFWWFDSEYVKQLYTLKINHEYRSESETWILSGTHNAYCPFEFTGNTKNDKVPSALYMPNHSRTERIKATVVSYFSRFKYIFRKLISSKAAPRNPLLKKGV